MAANHVGSGTPWRLGYNPAPPYGLSLWVYPTDTVNTTQAIWCHQKNDGSAYHMCYLDGTSGQFVVEIRDGASFSSVGTGTGTMNAWNHVALTVGTPMRISVNGSSWSASGATLTPTINAIRMGARQTASPAATYGDHFTGLTAEIGLWGGGDLWTANTSWHIAMVNKRCPLFKPIEESSGQVLTRYWPMWNTAVDRMGVSSAWSVPSSPYGDHCPQIYPSSGMGGARAA